MGTDIDLSVPCPGWEKALPEAEALVQRVSDTVLGYPGLIPQPPLPMELSVVLADNAFIRQLNASYRKKDAPTNVLSFPSYDLVPGTPWPVGEEEIFTLGDIIFALETVQKEAEEQKKPFEGHFSHLLVHGLLHLVGYDHVVDEQAEQMEALEIAILDSIGISNPYEVG